MSAGAIKEAWFRLLHTMGNPVDLCDPHVLATPVLEECRRTIVTHRVGRASVYLPYIYHQLIRGVANVVDSFLGIQPSLSVAVPAALGVPLELYGLNLIFSPATGHRVNVIEGDGTSSLLCFPQSINSVKNVTVFVSTQFHALDLDRHNWYFNFFS
ncbi:unnamed protein product [Echinostoma caproni]|uniref:Alcohol dehydrogenase superfamily, zinc-type n=1 Tax=Echinostoma caproni TaxID=27848 RepID=A0A183BC99_9TREM|nr:unnamed protein product [Echinostoma caproni]